MISNAQFKALAKKYGTPLYVYDVSVMERQFKALKVAISYEPKRIHFAIKANSNLYILKLLRDLGVGFDAGSPTELFLAKKAGALANEISVTGRNFSRQELEYIIKHKTYFHADSLSQLEQVGKLAKGAEVGVRINPASGAGHHAKVVTAGMHNTFGIYYKDVNKIKEIAKKYGLKIIGVHQHIGSGILGVDSFFAPTETTIKIAQEFENLRYINIGGGLGIPYKPQDKSVDVKKYGIWISKKMKELSFVLGKDILLLLEPGRYLTGQAGNLLMEVTSIKKTPAGELVAGTNSGMTHLIRPAMYGAYHKVDNISNPNGRKQKVTIVGNICESSDVFAKDRQISFISEGDLLVIRDAGAHSFAMGSRYNGRLLPAEILIQGKKDKLIRRRDKFEDFLPR